MQIAACLPAVLEKDGQYDGVELVVPLLRVVVHAAEELAEAHVVCLRRGVWVSGAASSVRAAPADQCAIKTTDGLYVKTIIQVVTKSARGLTITPPQPQTAHMSPM